MGWAIGTAPFKEVAFSVMPKPASSAVAYCNRAYSLPSAMLIFAMSPCAGMGVTGVAANYFF
jgi:hypothetical protein